jgi:hypothetical protein
MLIDWFLIVNTLSNLSYYFVTIGLIVTGYCPGLLDCSRLYLISLATVSDYMSDYRCAYMYHAPLIHSTTQPGQVWYRNNTTTAGMLVLTY